MSLRYLFLLLIPVCFACRKNDPPKPQPSGPVTRTEINTWILDSLRYFYLWNDALPARPDTSEETLAWFKSLLSPSDLFSVLYHPLYDSTQPQYLLTNFGIEMSVLQWPLAPGGAIGIIKLVVPSSDAANRGLVRGSYITRINGELITPATAAQLVSNMPAAQTLSLTPATIEQNNVTEQAAISLQNKTYEHPLTYSIELINGRTTARLFYNSFRDATNAELLSTFTKFKQSGVKELVLDLRYNRGGSVSSAAMLTALIAPGINANSAFVQYSGNKRLGKHAYSFAQILAVPENGQPVSFSSLAPGSLGLSRVFILCGHETASAAELVINNLKPFTKVVLIGEKTYGKDKGAISVRDMRSPRRVPWIMLPVTYHLANSKGEGNYANGITPDYVLDEMSEQPLADLLYRQAFNIINENGRMAALPAYRTLFRPTYNVLPVVLPHP
ncbi:S41 family peptidase [uncultured Chitinophaga sp.]|uniref:S41 family peptidase n=1 Tax=uncultured Chitinophaga sp. TaxID=339340 RepID=UPI0025FAF56F|nr:S41 family peptidase [uncultured Chitinophaga sp.]